jgi:Transposase DDE domain group 1
MTNDNLLPFSFPAVSRKQVTAAFDGGRLTSDGGDMLLAMAERRLGVADRLARCFPGRRDPTRITHTLSDMIRARIFATSRGYEDADDLDFLRTDPAFKLACGKLPDTGSDLCSQPTLSRLENAHSLKDAIHFTWALVDQWMVSYEGEPVSVTLDIDDTCDVVHGHQQLSLFNAHYDERCFLPIHVYDTERSRPVAVILRPGKPASRCALIYAGWCGIFENVGRKPASCSGAMGITRGPRRWRGDAPLLVSRRRGSASTFASHQSRSWFARMADPAARLRTGRGHAPRQQDQGKAFSRPS